LVTKFIVKVQPVDEIVALLEDEACVSDLSVVDGVIFVSAVDVALFRQRLPLLVSQVKGFLDEVKMVKSDLESVFKSAVEEAE
ncbi:MAG: hypothetical protein GX638_15240, partial [Crenarchaeota archaeon]|nr:hypothetical protein [Thermoproteota archaeon]